MQVIASASVSCGQPLVAITAADCARAGSSRAEVIAAASHAATHTRAFTLLASVDAAVTGGRVPPIVRTLANVLNRSIMLATQSDGRVKADGALLEERRIEEWLARFAAQ